MDIQFTVIQKIVIAIIPLIFAITVHEVSHGWVANRLGDPTAKMLGRLTLNPIKHIDPLGTLIIPALLLIFTNFAFGWAKPVPVTWRNLKNPKRDMAIVAIAGPITNFLMALIWGLVAKLAMVFSSTLGYGSLVLFSMGQFGILINLVLGILNLIPIPPLDGSRVVASFLSPKAEYAYMKIEPYGFFILLALIISKILFYIMWPPIILGLTLISNLFGLPLGN